MENSVFDYNVYYEPRSIITYLENILKKDFESIKTYVHSSGINVTKEQIQKFLDRKLVEENPELKKRIESPKGKIRRNLSDISDEDIRKSAQEIVDSICIGRYIFEPYSLKYFNRYVDILKCKIDKLFNIIQCIGVKKTSGIKDILDDLDIVLDVDGSILGSDIVRLVNTTIYNINTLSNKIREANNLDIYLTFKMSEESIYANGFFESEIYPSIDLQIKRFCFYSNEGYVPLTEKQREEIKSFEEENVKKYVLTLWDDLYD